jgi:hypothetical protein
LQKDEGGAVAGVNYKMVNLSAGFKKSRSSSSPFTMVNNFVDKNLLSSNEMCDLDPQSIVEFK